MSFFVFETRIIIQNFRNCLVWNSYTDIISRVILKDYDLLICRVFFVTVFNCYLQDISTCILPYILQKINFINMS
jgi:hypothetical protein